MASNLRNLFFVEESFKVDGRKYNIQLPKVFSWVLLLYLIIFLWSTWYVVDKDENGVVQLFGKYVRTEEPGLHFKLPWPLEKVTKVAVTKVRRMEIGFRTVKTGPPAVYEEVLEESEMLTGDENIVDLDFIVQYQVADAARWLFRYRDSEEALNYLSQSCMRLVVGYNSFETTTTSGRITIQEEVEQLLGDICRSLDFGPVIKTVQLQDAHPPSEVMPAFKEVNNAKEDKQKFIQQAESYRNRELPLARGQAEKLINLAMADSIERCNRAEGEAKRFLDLWTEYQKAPDINNLRLRLQAAEAVLPGCEMWLMRKDGLLPHLNLKDPNP